MVVRIDQIRITVACERLRIEPKETASKSNSQTREERRAVRRVRMKEAAHSYPVREVFGQGE